MGTGKKTAMFKFLLEIIGETNAYGRHMGPGMTHGDRHAGCVLGVT